MGCGERTVFPGRKRAEFPGMAGPSLSKMHLQHGFAVCGAHELVHGSLLREDMPAEGGTAKPFLRAGIAQTEK